MYKGDGQTRKFKFKKFKKKTEIFAEKACPLSKVAIPTQIDYYDHSI